MNGDNKRDVWGRFRVTLAADWPPAMVKTIEESTGAKNIAVRGPVLEGEVELEVDGAILAPKAVQDWVKAALGVLMKAPKTPTVLILATKG